MKSQSLGLEISFSSRENLVRSRSHLVPKTEGFGVVSVSGHNVSFYKLIFNDKSLLNFSATNRLSVGLYSTACRSCSLCLYAIDSSNSCIIRRLCYLVLRPTYQLEDVAVHAITWILQKMKDHIV